MTMAQGSITTELLQRELLSAERALATVDRGLSSPEDDDGSKTSSAASEDAPIAVRLKRLQEDTEELLLAQEIAKVVGTGENTDNLSKLEQLGRIISQHATTITNNKSSIQAQQPPPPLYQRLLDEFENLHEFVRADLMWTFRQNLQQCHYPKAPPLVPDNEEDKNEYEDDTHAVEAIRELVASLHQVEAIRTNVNRHTTSQRNRSATNNETPSVVQGIVTELMRSMVERVRYHFVDTPHGASSSAVPHDRSTLTRIDRLPEWLLGFVRDALFESGAWEFVRDGVFSENADAQKSPREMASVAFLNELVRLIQWVLHERNFFRHDMVAGPNSKPLVLCQAVEQLLQFDAFLQSLVPVSHSRRIVSLMDACICGDEELLQWWLERERENVLAALSNDISKEADNVEEIRVAPRAELFCALIRSVQTKAAVFSHCGPYLSHVAAPLCVHFLDALHEAASDRQAFLRQRSQPTDAALADNIRTWIQLLNGAHLASSQLLSPSSSTLNIGVPDNADDDLARFGRSLKKLESVLLDDFVTTVVEVFLMEKTKFAGYLMRCSHLLSSSDSNMIPQGDVSPDLQDTHHALKLIIYICENGLRKKESGVQAVQKDASHYAPNLMLDRLFSLVAEKLLEVALDLQGMTPDLLQPGCAMFAQDVNALFGESTRLPTHALRVLDICTLMSLSSSQLGGIGRALCGLAGRPAPLTEASFEADDRLFEEAVSMIRAKGFVYLELADVFAVLNRRRDL